MTRRDRVLTQSWVGTWREEAGALRRTAMSAPLAQNHTPADGISGLGQAELREHEAEIG
jgi:hypothetical protein